MLHCLWTVITESLVIVSSCGAYAPNIHPNCTSLCLNNVTTTKKKSIFWILNLCITCVYRHVLSWSYFAEGPDVDWLHRRRWAVCVAPHWPGEALPEDPAAWLYQCQMHDQSQKPGGEKKALMQNAYYILTHTTPTTTIIIIIIISLDWVRSTFVYTLPEMFLNTQQWRLLKHVRHELNIFF